jgi:hypothetical protein
MRRRTLLATGGLIAVSGCLGTGGDGSGPTTVSGSGDHTESGIDLDAGLTVVESRHSGRRGFKTTLVSESESETVFAFHVGEYHGEDAALLDGGSYRLTVEADGDWEAEIRQPRDESGDPVPDSVSGDRPAVRGPYEFGGQHSATATHEGSGSFEVRVFPATGDLAALLFSDLGSVEDETEFEYEGVGWIDVEAAGEWTLELR